MGNEEVLVSDSVCLKINVDPTPAVKAAEKMKDYVEEVLGRGDSVLLMVSGGSSLDVLDALEIDEELMKKGSLTLAVVDERYTGDEESNNCAQVMESDFYSRYSGRLALIDTRVKVRQSHAKHAKDFEEALRNWQRENQNGEIVGLFGVGGDGHTSGIMPDSEVAFSDSKSWVLAYDIGDYDNPHKKRTTTTPAFIKIVDKLIVFMRGEGKAEPLKRLKEAEDYDPSYPSTIFAEIAKKDGRQVDIYTDQNV